VATVIPRIIHQIWVGDTNPRPDVWMWTWKRHHPDWQYVLWDEQRVASRRWRTQRHMNWYRARKLWHGIADCLRYEVLFDYGGFIAPADTKCLLALDDLVQSIEQEGSDAFTCFEAKSETLGRLEIPGSLVPLLGAARGCELAGIAARVLAFTSDMGEPWQTSGNRFFASLVERLDYPRIHIFPYYYFVPDYWSGDMYTGDGPVYCQQFFGTTTGAYQRLAEGHLW
jgi:hypothetical protein